IVGMAPRRITRSGIARSFQIPQLFLEHTALENLLLAASSRDRVRWPWLRLGELPQREEMRELLDLFGLLPVADKPIREMPEGVRKLIDIAVALALKPRLLLMDEPTSGVSSAEKVGIMDTLARALAVRRVTSVFVEHDMEIVERYARRIAVWSAGRILALGPPSQVMTDPEVLRNVTGV
ncbi:ATP-binding cassette domain-containing protein, partial [Azospirillum sp.]|uniref:ATP-binding cassette domain-containing protein n=1 Tax=Azospirillum sp. TaxID=34012 RepID=UPI002D73393D